MKTKHIPAHIILGIIIVAVSWTGYNLIYLPFVEYYDFNTITKVSNDKYPDPIYLKFNWVTIDELQVGNDVDISLIVTGLPYSSNNTKNISLEFNEKYLNFWDKYSDKPLPHNKLILKQNLEENYFYSEPIKIRFIVPTDVPATFCDDNIQTCFEIENIIHPAPHDLEVQIQTNRIALGVSFMLVILSSVIVWYKFTLASK